MGKKTAVLDRGDYSREKTTMRTARGKFARYRQMHRSRLLDWADESAVDEEARTVTDPRKLVPFHGKSYGGAVRELLRRLRPVDVKDMKGTFTAAGDRVKEWTGKKNEEIDAIAATPWTWSSVLFEAACKANPDLLKALKNRRCTRPGVKNHVTDPLQKWCGNVVTIQRQGGCRRYGVPLSDCLYAIDSRWRLNKAGKPELQFRFVVGRSSPQKERKTAAALKEAG